jgi:uncharacterized SAM-binding protein YcdF (DUF218 family)
MTPGLKALARVGEHLVVAAGLVVLALILSAGYWLQQSDSPAEAEAMVVLGEDFIRPAYAADIYRMGLAKKVYVGRTYRRRGERLLDKYLITYPREEEIYRAMLRKKGVPDEAIEYFGDDLLSTAQEAEALAAQLAQKSGRLLVVTSPYHVFRARRVFKDYFPGWDVRVLATTEDRMPLAWWTSQESARHVVLELPKILYYMLGGRFHHE